MKVIRRPLVLEAEPPDDSNPNWRVSFDGQTWEVEHDQFMKLYELEALKNQPTRD